MSQQTIDPRVAELLDAISRDPKARMFGIDPRRLATWRPDASSTLRIDRTGRTPAERALLDSHRAEAVELLIDVHRAALVRDQDCRSVDTQRRRPASDVTSAAFEWSNEGQEQHQIEPGLVDLLVRRESWSSMRVDDRRALVVSAIRLCDGPRTRLHLALDDLSTGRVESAGRVAEAVVARSTDPALRKCAFEVLGAVLADRGRETASLDAYRAAMSIASRHGLTPEAIAIDATMCLVRNVVLCDGPGVYAAARALDDLGRVVGETVRHQISFLSRARVQGWTIAVDSLRLASKTAVRAGPVSLEVLHALS